MSFIQAASAAERTDCFKAINKHITEAIEHNKEVGKLYSNLSDGESERLSFALITSERISRLLIKNIEKESRIYQENGIPLLCDELAHMKDVPAFRESLPENLRPQKLLKYDYKALSKILKNKMKDNLLDEAYEAVSLDLYKLEEEPYQQCMTRHFLESIARTIKLSTVHRNEALKLGLPDPINVIKKFIKLQRSGLFLTHYLDNQAFPLQQKGLLIYCQDVPPIDWK